MGTSDNKLSDLVDLVKSWIPRRSEPVPLSRDFWMPDQSCRVCYECDTQFTVFNRRHHCRLCGRVFCAKCTANSIPANSDEQRAGREDWERIRVCNYCFRQWEQGIGGDDNGVSEPTPILSPSPSATSLASTKSSCTCNSSNSSVGSAPYSTGPYQRVPYSTSCQFVEMDSSAVEPDDVTSGRSTQECRDTVNASSNQYSFCTNRSDDEDGDYGLGTLGSEYSHYGPITVGDMENVYLTYESHPDGGTAEGKGTIFSSLAEQFDSLVVDDDSKHLEEEVGEAGPSVTSEASVHDLGGTETEPVDFENNGLLWLPPEPADEEDERVALMLDEDDGEGLTGEWGYMQSSNSFGSGEHRNREKSIEEHRNAMKNVVEGHFRALIAQLLQVENIPVGGEEGKESWLDIIASLSWEAATLLKPDMSKGGGMDPGGYVKVKCIACGHRGESKVVKGVVCKKNVAHRRMTSKIDRPRFLILGGALEYQRVTNHLSSVDTLLQQEMDHLKMAVAKIDAHHPDVLLVEKSVSRHAQDYILTKDISLVLNIKRPLLERIARCTGAQIVPSIDHLTSPKLGYCDTFHVDKFFEEHSSAGQGGKKLTKTLMFFEGCPKPFGCTVLLKGASGDELKKVKHVVQYGVFAAYHLALETSFLADEGASLPELPLKSPITVALPDKPSSSIERSISTIPGFPLTPDGKPLPSQPETEHHSGNKSLILNGTTSTKFSIADKLDGARYPCLTEGPCFENVSRESNLTVPASQVTSSDPCKPLYDSTEVDDIGDPSSVQRKLANIFQDMRIDNVASNSFSAPKIMSQNASHGHSDWHALSPNYQGNSELTAPKEDENNLNPEVSSSKEEFSPSTSDHQSILVSLSTRCVWKGTVCERAHLFRIKYYGSFDKPLGRYLRDNLFDQSYCCSSCELPAEAHVHCYTHRQGSLTISVKRLQEFLLPGEREGKIWMWHRCLRCPRKNGFPPATQRIVMSDAAWGLSFGKFLELSFSNHAAASRVASCGHSLHRDCLRFYGFGRMVACFRYASIDVLSVHLPPSKVEFNYGNQEWIEKEAKEVRERVKLLFTEVHDALHRIREKLYALGQKGENAKVSEKVYLLEELEMFLAKEKQEVEESLEKALSGELKTGQPFDILEINKLRRQIINLSYIWDQHLIHSFSSKNKTVQEGTGGSSEKSKDKIVSSVEPKIPPNTAKGLGSGDSFLVEQKSNVDSNQVRGGMASSNQPNEIIKRREGEQEINCSEAAESSLSASAEIGKSDTLESEKVVKRMYSNGEFPVMASLSDTLDAAWTGESQPSVLSSEESCSSAGTNSLKMTNSASGIFDPESCNAEQRQNDMLGSAFALPSKGLENVNSMKNGGLALLNHSISFKSNLTSSPRANLAEYSPVYVQSFWESERQSGAKLLLPVGINDTIVPVYDDEPTSIISYALVSNNYHAQVADSEKPKDGFSTTTSLPLFDTASLLSFSSLDESTWDSHKSFGSSDESLLSLSGIRNSQQSDPLSTTRDLHTRVSFIDDIPQGKVKYAVTCYYAKQFEALRRMCCPSEFDYIRSLSRCRKWGAQGGKSNVFFAKTLDDRFIIKQVTKTELESFIKFAPAYFKYLSESISSGSPTCLAKILGIYQVSSKHLKGGKETKMDVLVMENLLFQRKITRLYDLKGSSRSRYNPDTSGSNKVLLDQNLIEAMPTSPIFVGNKAKRLLERAVWNDTAFLASVDVMDYSLLVGVDEGNHELVLGIIDFMRQYTWDKHLETWVKTSGILGGPKNESPTVISPQMYKKRFRKAMTAYFLMVPDQWSPPTIIPSRSQSDLCDENLQNGSTVD